MSSPVQPAPVDLAMPCFGLGTWLAEPGQVGSAVESALRAGYRLVDCASIYENEHEVGDALQRSITSGIVQRRDVWLTGKLWNDCHLPEHVRPACIQSLTDLQVDSLELYLVHFPVSFVHGHKAPTTLAEMASVPIEDTWEAMEALRTEGLVQHIGVSNFEIDDLERLRRSATTMPAVNQFECHPMFSRTDLVDYCHRQSIAVTAHTSLGSPANGMHEHPALLDDPTIGAIGGEYGKSPAQVLLRWALQRGIAVIPKSIREDRLVQNAAIFDFALADRHMLMIDEMNRSVRYNHTTTAWLGRSKFDDQ